MASTPQRRPLPAVVALLALLVLAGLVWWRVLNRDSKAKPVSRPCPPATYKVHLPDPGSVSVLVLNATKHSGIATRARASLVAAGFSSPSAAGNDQRHLNKISAVADIRFGPTAKSGATLLRYYFPGATLTPVNTKSQVVVVSLGRGYHEVASPAVVRKELGRDKAVAGTPTPTSAANC